MNDPLQLLNLPSTNFHNDYYSELLTLRSAIKKLIDEEDVVSKAFFELEKLLPHVDSKLRERIDRIRIQLKQPEDLLQFDHYWPNKKSAPKDISIAQSEIRNALADIDLKPNAPLFNQLGRLIEDCYKLMRDLQQNTDPNIKTVCNLISGVRNYYIDYRDKRIISGRNEQRLAWCDGRTRMRSFLGYHYVNAGTALRFTPFFREDGENRTGIVMSNRDNKSGAHSVLKVHRMFTKMRPDSPLEQAAYDRFLEGEDSAATELILLENRTGAFPALASKAVEGMSLYDFLEKHSDWIHLIDPFNLSALIIKSLLLCLSDGKADNFIAVIEYDNNHKPVKVTIVAIDSDHLLEKGLEAFKEKDKLKHQVQLRFIFGFFPQMINQIHPEFREYFLQSSPEAIMIRLLSTLAQQERHYLGYSASNTEQTNQNNLTVKELIEVNVPVKFLPGRLQSLYKLVSDMQGLMKTNSTITHNQLFQHFYPVESFVYQHLLQTHKTPLSAIAVLYKGTSPYIEDIPGVSDTLLQKMPEYPDTHSEIKRKKENGETLPQACQRFFDHLDYQSLPSIEEQEEILVDIIIKFPFLQQLVFRNCDALNDERLATLGDRFSHITSITLINCNRVTGIGLTAFMQKNLHAHVTLENMVALSYLTLLSLIEQRHRLSFGLNQVSQADHNRSYLARSLMPVLSAPSSARSPLPQVVATSPSSSTTAGITQGYLNDLDYAQIPDVREQKRILQSIVTNFSAIRELVVRNCDALNDEQLIMLSHLPQLSSVTLDNCKNIKGKGVSALLCQHPNLQIRLVNTLQLSYNTWLSLLENAHYLTIVIGQHHYQTNDQHQLVSLLSAAADCEADQLLTALLLYGAHLIKDPLSEFSALHFACERGKLRVVLDLLECKVAVNCKDNKTGLTALDVCCRKYQSELDTRKRNLYFNIIIKLLKNGAVDCEKDNRPKILDLVLKSLSINRDAKLRHVLFIFACYHNLLTANLVPQLVDQSSSSLDLTVPQHLQHFRYQLNHEVIASIKNHARSLHELDISGSEGLTPACVAEIFSMEKLGSLYVDYDQAVTARFTLSSNLTQNGKAIHITKVKLDKRNLNITQLCSFLKTTQICTELDLCNCGLTEATANELAKALKENTSLRIVKLNNNSSLTDQSTANIISALKTNPYLEELYLDSTNAGMQSAQALNDLLRESTALRVLTVNRATFGDTGVQLIAKALQERINQKINHGGYMPMSLQTLMLNELKMQANGARALARALMFHERIQQLDINYNEAIGNEGAVEILVMLQNNSNITACRTENIGATGELAQQLPLQVIANIRHHQALLLENVSRRHRGRQPIRTSQTSVLRSSGRSATESFWVQARTDSTSPARAAARSSSGTSKSLMAAAPVSSATQKRG